MPRKYINSIHCSIEGCEKPAEKRGWCAMHYRRWLRYGDPFCAQVSTAPQRPAVNRFWDHIDKNGPIPEYAPELGPCWIWTGFIREDGYGTFLVDGKRTMTHRFSYALEYGPIPVGLEPDHLCRVRACSRPTHLEAVTHQINMLRGATTAARNAAVTHCPKGHEYSVENTYHHKGMRLCRACARERERLKRQRLASEKSAPVSNSGAFIKPSNMTGRA